MQKFSSQLEFKKKNIEGILLLELFSSYGYSLGGCNFQEYRVVEDKQNMKKIYMEIKMSV